MALFQAGAGELAQRGPTLLRTRLMTVMAAIIYMAVFSVWLPKSLHSSSYLPCLSPFNALRKQPSDQPLICLSICHFLAPRLLPHLWRHLRRFLSSTRIPETETSLRSSCTRVCHFFKWTNSFGVKLQSLTTPSLLVN